MDLRTWDAWRQQHQPFELNWWREALAGGHSCDDLAFAANWQPVFEFICDGVKGNDGFGRVLDIGCGPRPPFAPCTVIEPLAADYQRITPESWWQGVEVRALPAEYILTDFIGAFDTLICWNCLDHTIGWKDILRNMAMYGAPDACYAVATDFFPPFLGHPGFEREEFMREIRKHFVIEDQREPLGRQMALRMVRK